MRNLREKHGITLIALIITVIVLLILAGTAISISVNSTDLFSKSNMAKESWNEGVREEESSITDALDVLDIAANPDSARVKLTVKVNENGTVESPYYVNYPSAKGTIKCRVLYNDKTYGVQLVSVDSVTTLTLGKKDANPNVEGEIGSIERAQNSYNRAITTLNEKAEEYMETRDGSILATDARCLGSDPLNKNYPENLTGNERQSMMFIAESSQTYMNEYNGKFFDIDTHYEPDYERVKKIGADSVKNPGEGEYGQFYHLASHNIISNSSSHAFYTRAGKRTKFI